MATVKIPLWQHRAVLCVAPCCLYYVPLRKLWSISLTSEPLLNVSPSLLLCILCFLPTQGYPAITPVTVGYWRLKYTSLNILDAWTHTHINLYTWCIQAFCFHFKFLSSGGYSIVNRLLLKALQYCDISPENISRLSLFVFCWCTNLYVKAVSIEQYNIYNIPIFLGGSRK